MQTAFAGMEDAVQVGPFGPGVGVGPGLGVGVGVGVGAGEDDVGLIVKSSVVFPDTATVGSASS